jgi:hypothetical protein
MFCDVASRPTRLRTVGFKCNEATKVGKRPAVPAYTDRPVASQEQGIAFNLGGAQCSSGGYGLAAVKTSEEERNREIEMARSGRISTALKESFGKDLPAVVKISPWYRDIKSYVPWRPLTNA